MRENKYNALQGNKYLAGWPLWNGPSLLGGMAKAIQQLPPKGERNLLLGRAPNKIDSHLY
jgi:hypothetical protein